MLYSSSRRSKPVDLSASTILIAGGFISLLCLLPVVVMLPKFFIIRPVSTITVILAASITGLYYTISVYGLKLPMLLHGLLFCFSQWVYLAVWRWWGGSTPFSLNPIVMFRNDPARVTVLIGAGLIGVLFGRALCHLQRFPETAPASRLMKPKGEEEVVKADLTPWISEWKAWRRRIIFGLVIDAGIYGIQSSFIPSFCSRTGWFVLLGLALTGILLISDGYFYYRRAIWQSGQLAPDSKMQGLWRRWVLFILLVAVPVALIAPSGFPAYGKILLDKIVSGKTAMPFRPPNQGSAKDQILEKVVEPPTSFERFANFLISAFYLFFFILPFIILSLLVLGIAGFILFRLGYVESRRLLGLPQALVKLFLFWRENFFRVKRRFSGEKNIRRIPDAPDRTEEKRDWEKAGSWGRGARAVVRRGYYRLIKEARGQGLNWRNSQSPIEVAKNLEEMVPEEKEAVDKFTGVYHQARYGPDEIPSELAAAFERLRKAIGERLRVIKKGEG